MHNLNDNSTPKTIKTQEKKIIKREFKGMLNKTKHNHQPDLNKENTKISLKLKY